jgi:8-oxo-dGTP pyrophosphatase MutT (NUDIX family)
LTTTKVFRIGASGHRDLGDPIAQHYAAHCVRELFTSYAEQYPNLVLIAPLAIGADQLFVQTALDLNIPVEAVIPSEDYETHYAPGAERATYQRLLQHCRRLHLQPFSTHTDDAYLAAGQWIVDQSDIVLLIWNGQPAKGRGGTADIAAHAWRTGRPFVQINATKQAVQMYGDLQNEPILPSTVKQEDTISRQLLYQGPTLSVHQYHFSTAKGEEIVRDIVERPESVLIVPVNAEGIITLIEEYDLGAGIWQLTFPGGKLQLLPKQDLEQEVQRELREELGYRAGRLEPLLHIHSHPGYIAHKVHLVVAHHLEWDPLPREDQEEIRAITYPLTEALEETLKDYRCDPEAALALWIYAQKYGFVSGRNT